MIWTNRWRFPIVVFLTICLVPIGVLMMGGWHMSNMIKDRALEPERGIRPFDLEVVNLAGDRITLLVTPQANKDDWRSGGIWGLRWNGGYAQVGEILQINNQQVVRKFIPLMGNLKCGEMVWLDVFTFPDEPQKAFGLPTQKVFLSSSLGEFPAWFIDGSYNTWVIFVHGKRDHPPQEPLRAYPILPAVNELGLPSLIITYRNDWGAPASPDGFHWFGLTEWEDLEGAVKYALEHGAEKLILVGYSMGGAIVMNFLYQSQLAQKVRGVILDAPMLDFGATVDLGARELGLPRFLTKIAKLMARLRFGIDWKALNYLSHVHELAVPILLFHGDADTGVPVETSDALARARPDIVTYHRVPGATHVRSWNMNPYEYENSVHNFLELSY